MLVGQLSCWTVRLASSVAVVWSVWLVTSLDGQFPSWSAVWMVSSLVGQLFGWSVLWFVSCLDGQFSSWSAVWMVSSLVSQLDTLAGLRISLLV